MNYDPEHQKRLEEMRKEISDRRANEAEERHGIKGFANFCGYTDVEPWEVVEVRTPNKVIIRAMDSEMTKPATCLGVGGFSAVFDNYSQEWEVTSNKDNRLETIRWSKAKKHWYDKHGRRFRMSDTAIKFYDNNF